MKKNRVSDKTISLIRSCLDKYGDKIYFAFLFGSHAGGRQTPLSDIDIAVFFNTISRSGKTDIEHELSMILDGQVNVLRLEDEYVSPLVKIAALDGVPVVINDNDLLGRFTLSIIHQAEEHRRLIDRLRRAA